MSFKPFSRFFSARRLLKVTVMIAFLGGTVTQTPPSIVSAAPMKATIVVNTTADEYGTGTSCSLREAIQAANTDAAFGGCPAGSGSDTITLAAGTYRLTLANSGGVNEDNNATGDLDINASLTITGAGSGSTFIQAGTNTSDGIDKVFGVNPMCASGVNVTIQDVTIRYGYNTQPYGAADYSYTGGGLDWCGGGGPESFTLQNAVVSDNTNVNGYGGGLNVDSVSGNTTVNIDNVDFINNKTLSTINTSNGGALNVWNSTVTISNSVFQNNSVPAGSRNGGAINLNNGSLMVNTSDFSGNTASAGSAIYINSGTATLHYNRIVGNTPASTALNVSVGTVNATENWWGCSTGPSAAPCDRTNAVVGFYTPWLRDQLTSASGTTLVTNQVSILTASFRTDSSGADVSANLDRITGLPVTWNNSNGAAGSISGAQGTIQVSGTANGTFTATAPGSTTLYARVDNDNTSPVSSNVLGLTVNKANTTTAITSDLPDPSTPGQTVTVAFSVTGAYGNAPTAPAGDVTVSDGVNSCTATVAVGSCDVTLATAGNRTLVATYAGDTNFNGSMSAGVAHAVSTPPNVTNVSSSHSNGNFTVSEVIPIAVTFNVPVNVTGTPQLTLETGATDRIVDYSSGSGTNTLTFSYTVQAGDTSTDLDYVATTSLALHGGTIRDTTDTYAADLTLASPGAAGSLGANKNIVIDTKAPVITFTSTPGDLTLQSSFTFGFGADETVTGYTCTLLKEAATLIGPIGCSSPVPGSVAGTGTYTFLVTATDLAGNYGSNSFTWTVDITPPDTAIQPIGLPANPTSVTNASFTYTGSDVGSAVAGFQCALDGAAFAACTSPMPQNYTGLADGSHTFQVRAVDNAGNSDPTPASYTWVVDTVNPTVTMSSAALNPTNTSPIPVTVQFSKPVIGFAVGDITPTNATVNNFVPVAGDTFTFDLTPSGQGLVTADIAAGAAVDAAGNGNTAAAQFSRTYDTTTPNVTVEQASTQSDPTGVSPVSFTVTFSEDVTGFVTGEVDLSASTAPGTLSGAVTGGPRVYTVTVSGMTGDGLVIAQIPAGVAQDAVGNANAASSSSDNTVSYIYAAPPVIIEGSSVNVTISRNGSPTPFALTLHATDVNSDPLSWFIQTPAGHGAATIDSGPSDLTNVHYTPALNYTGADSFVVRVSDGHGGTDDITVNVTILEPVAVSKINSAADTGDGQILENERTAVAITQLLVVFNNRMEPVDVQNTANYSLVQDVSTPVTIDNIVYDDLSHTSTLGINHGAALPEGKYSLTVKSVIHDALGNALSVDFVRIFYVDSSGIRVVSGGVALPNGTVIADGATLNTTFSEVWVTFNEDAANPADDRLPDDVTNPANYLLVRPGPNGVFDTASCLSGLATDDVAVPVGPVTYGNGGGAGPFVAKVRVNNGTGLENGLYRLFACGTTSITDLTGNPLNNGTDYRLSFTILVSRPGGSGEKGIMNPATGFAPDVFTAIPRQPAEKTYRDLGGLWLEIPAINVKASITGVPLLEQGWDLTWLNRQVGWLEGTAYPTWTGNTVLTAHVSTADGLPGPFASLKTLKYGDIFYIHFGGQKYTYTVQSKTLVKADDARLITQHEKLDWVTLITCQQYDEQSKTYLYRWVVRAVITRIESEK